MKHVVCREEERDLQHERYGALENGKRAVIILPVVCLQDHETLVALEILLDVLDRGAELVFLLSCLFLDLIRTHIKRQYDKAEHKAQEHDVNAGNLDMLVKHREDYLEYQFNRSDYQRVKLRKELHAAFKLSP